MGFVCGIECKINKEVFMGDLIMVLAVVGMYSAGALAIGFVALMWTVMAEGELKNIKKFWEEF